jgi:puromycin-sensitive aminopeptidase
MSTYLVALVVGEFDVVSSTTERGVLTSVYMPPGKGKMGEFALRVATQSLDFYEEVFAVKYPLTKSDLLAIPDFAAGAMENFGCVTYRSTKIEVDELTGTTSQAALLGSARTVAHEQVRARITCIFADKLELGCPRFITNIALIVVDTSLPLGLIRSCVRLS